MKSVRGKSQEHASYRSRTPRLAFNRALLRMSAAVGTRDPKAFNAALLESQSLRMECGAIRAEVESHKSEHFPVPTQDSVQSE